ncbi:MAG: hypothetical protein OHK0046_13130 [Anaerolineae bacterium]
MSMTQQQAFIDKWVGYLNANNHEMSLIAAQKLGNVKDSSAVTALIQALKNRPDDVRTLAARSLGLIGDRTAVPALIRLLEDRNAQVASTAADSLGAIGDSSAVPALVKVLQEYKSDGVRHKQLHGFDRGVFTAAVKALQKINTPAARQALTKYHR